MESRLISARYFSSPRESQSSHLPGAAPMSGSVVRVPSGKTRLFVSQPAAKIKGLINTAGRHHEATHTDTHSWNGLDIKPTSRNSGSGLRVRETLPFRVRLKRIMLRYHFMWECPRVLPGAGHRAASEAGNRNYPPPTPWATSAFISWCVFVQGTGLKLLEGPNQFS